MSSTSSSNNDFISLPKGGGSISGLGEKFSPDLHTGTGNFSIPIHLPNGRNGFQPEISLQYSTGNPNGIAGFGWTLSLPEVKRKTSKGIPIYDDCKDIFVLSGFEDLVKTTDDHSVFGQFRPRTESTFAHITFENKGSDSFWKVKNQNGNLSLYGKPNSADNDDSVISNPTRVSEKFAWRITETTDPFGNKVIYRYKKISKDCEDQAIESHLEQIDYVNFTNSGKEQYLISVIFDYEDRPDITSSFRSGFEIKMSKRLKSITIKSNGEIPLLVKKYTFEYDNSSLNNCSLLTKIQLIGYDSTTQNEVQELAPIEFDYTKFTPANATMTAIHGDIPTESLRSTKLNLLDLDGNGLPDIVSINGQISFFKNKGNGSFDSERIMKNAPSVSLEDPNFSFIDANGDGRPDIFQIGNKPGYFSIEYNGEWDTQSFISYKHSPTIDLSDPNTRLIDLTGDGITDIFHSGATHTYIFNNHFPEKAWKKSISKQQTNALNSPTISLSDPRVKFADMNGDGMQDLVIIEGKSISYWPNKGYGNWGNKVRMSSPINIPDHLELNRILLGDLDGDGLTDLVIIENNQVKLYVNKSGKSWSEEIVISGTPSFNSSDDVRIVDLFGNGTSGILFSTNQRSLNTSNYFFLDLTSIIKPYLLNEVNNNRGAITRIEYSTSTREFLNDKLEGLKWKTHLPFPVNIVKKTETLDLVSKSKLTTLYKYHHGHWDGEEREFRGFGMVEQLDTETFDDYNSLSLFLNDVGFNRIQDKFFTPPSLTKTWFHLGPIRNNKGVWETEDFVDEFSQFDKNVLEPNLISVLELSKLTSEQHRRDAARAMSRNIVRTESYVYDKNSFNEMPVSVQEFKYDQRIEQIPTTIDEKPIIFTFPTAQRTTVWECGEDPKTHFTFTNNYDLFGHAQETSVVAMPRRISKRTKTVGKNYNDDLNEQKILATHTKTNYSTNIPNQVFIHDRVSEISQYEYLDPNNIYYENDSTNLEMILKDQFIQAENIHTTIFSSLLSSEVKVIRHQLNYYDGKAFEGLALNQIGDFGCLVRSEILVFTDDSLDSAYIANLSEDRRPTYLSGNASVVIGTPTNFGAGIGYTLKNNSPQLNGYYIQSVQHKFAFQVTGNSLFKGLLIASKDANGNETTIHYDKFDLLPTKVIDAIGNELQANYNYQYFSPSKITDPNGNNSNVLYNSSGLPLKIWHNNHDSTQGGTENKPDIQFHYQFGYDHLNKIPISITTMSRTDHALALNGGNDLIKMIEYSDGFARVIQKIVQADNVLFGNLGDDNGLNRSQNGANAPAIGISNSSGKENTIVSGWTTFNNKGLPVEKYEPFFHDGFDFIDDAFFGKHSEFYYDHLGREQRILFPDDSESIHVYGSIANLSKPELFEPSPWEHFTYDANDLAFLAHKNTPSSTILNSLGKTIAVIHRNGNIPANDWLITKNSFDIKGNIQTITDSKHQIAFTYHYDLLNRVLRVDSIDAGKRTKIYDAIGNIIEYRDDKGSLVLKEYDVLNRTKHIWVRNDKNTNSLRLSEKIIYGDEPSIVLNSSPSNYLRTKPFKHFDEAGLTNYVQYDFKNNVLEKRRHVHNHLDIGSIIDWSQRTENQLHPKIYQSNYVFDGLNRMVQYTYPADVNNHRAQLVAKYNPSGKLRQVLLDGKIFLEHLAYNAKDQRLLIAYGNNIMTRYAYHEDNFRLLRLRTEAYTSPTAFAFNPNGSVIQDQGYMYDFVGNISAINHRENGSGLSNAPNELDRLFEYDAIYRLLSSTGRETERPNPMVDVLGLTKSSDINVAKAYSEKYVYDEMGNFLELKHIHDGQQTIRTFTNENSNNRLKEVDFSGTNVKYLYDLNGNLTDEGLSRRMTWDHSDRMTTFVIHDNNGNNSVESNYIYDAGGMRVAKKTKKGTTAFLTIYIDGLFEHSIDLTQSKENNHLHILDDKSRIAVVRVGDAMGDNKPAIQYHLGDHLGSSSICVGGNDATGSSKISCEEYYAYGETSFGSHAKKRYRYSGKERDEESGMYYYGARYYLPWIGRWTSCDPIGVEGGMNLYQFVAGNPILFKDLLGYSPKSENNDVITVGAVNTKNTILTNNPQDWKNPDNIRLEENDQLMVLSEGADKSFNKTDSKYKWTEVKVLSGTSEGQTGWIMEVLMDWDVIVLEQNYSDDSIPEKTTSVETKKTETNSKSNEYFHCTDECVVGFIQQNGPNVGKVFRAQAKSGLDPNGFMGSKGYAGLFKFENDSVNVENFTASIEASIENYPKLKRMTLGAQATAIGGTVKGIDSFMDTEIEFGLSIGIGFGGSLERTIDKNNQVHSKGSFDIGPLHLGLSR